jgi:dTDP-glucose 4,6-dehydratase
MKLMITGGMGFIGTNFTDKLLEETDWEIYVIDRLTYAANRRWEKVYKCPPPERLHIYIDDIINANTTDWPIVDAIIHFAAESHVDNSIGGAADFVHTNVAGTHKLLEYAKDIGVQRFLYISTDEVYGCTDVDSDYKFKETDILNPRNPYSATKAAGEHLTLAYWNTWDVPVVITRSSNNFGPWQHDEKLIPTVIRSVVQGKPVPVYGQGKNIREWISVLDNCYGILEVFEHGQEGEVYNIGSGYECSNFSLVMLITDYLAEEYNYDSEIHFVPDRRGHDLRYALDTSKIEAELGFIKPDDEAIECELENTIDWYWRKYEKKTDDSNT